MDSLTDVVFVVPGIPAPQGSKSAFVRGTRAVIVDGTSKVGREKHKAWRDVVTDYAMRAKEHHEQFTGPVSVEIEFFLPLPASDPHRSLHSTKPDVDKLIRSVFDSLTVSGLVRDDSLICSINATKIYARNGHWTGARIYVYDFSSVEEVARLDSKKKAKRAKQDLQ